MQIKRKLINKNYYCYKTRYFIKLNIFELTISLKNIPHLIIYQSVFGDKYRIFFNISLH